MLLRLRLAYALRILSFLRKHPLYVYPEHALKPIFSPITNGGRARDVQQFKIRF